MADFEVDEIKLETMRRLIRDGVPLLIIEGGPEWMVHQWLPDGVAPQSSYPTARLAASRALQLLGVGPVAPQTHPEEVQIGSISAYESNQGS